MGVRLVLISILIEYDTIVLWHVVSQLCVVWCSIALTL